MFLNIRKYRYLIIPNDFVFVNHEAFLIGKSVRVNELESYFNGNRTVLILNVKNM